MKRGVALALVLGHALLVPAMGFADVTNPVSGNVPATLSLTVGEPAAFGNFVPGTDRDYDASMTMNAITTAGGATLSVSDPSATAPGHLMNGTFALPSALQARATSARGTG